MTKMKVNLPNKVLWVSWSHPWVRTRKHGIDNVLTKVTQCYIAEYKGESKREDGKVVPRVRFMGDARIKWPLYSIDGTKGFTVNTNGDFVSKARGRKLTLKLAMEKAGLTTFERTQVWHEFLKLFHPNVPIPPTIPMPAFAVIDAEFSVEDKVVAPLGRVLEFPGPVPEQIPARLLISPPSAMVH